MPTSPLVATPTTSIVSALVTPAILILATGSLVASTLVRLGRIVDQSRLLIKQGEEFRRAGKSGAVAIIERRIDRQVHRAELARRALWGYYLAICVFLISSVTLALSQILYVRLEWVGPTMVLIGGFILIGATSMLFVEVGLSAGTLREEVESYKRGELD